MNSDEIVIELGLVSEKTLGEGVGWCEGLAAEPIQFENSAGGGYEC